MTDRILMNSSGMKISRPGFDVNTALEANLVIHPNMNPMRPIYQGSVTFTGVGSSDVSISNPSSTIPFCILKGSDNKIAGRSTFCIEMFSPFNIARVRNIDGIPRTVNFSVLI